MLSTMSSPSALQSISLERSKDNGFSWHGTLPLTAFDRLKSESFQFDVQQTSSSKNEHTAPLVEFVISCDIVAKQTGVYELSLVAQGDLPLTCQRCLDMVKLPIRLHSTMYMVQDESFLSALDEDDDVVVLSESGYAFENAEQGMSVNLMGLIEDEMLLSLPQSPRHEIGHPDCDVVIEHIDDSPEEASDNPFAKLAELKGKLG